MYKHKESTYGSHALHTLSSYKYRSELSIVPEYGANIVGLKINGKTILDGYASPEDMESGKWSRTEFLIPFPNRLKDGKYKFKSKKYQFPITDTKRNNALHGFRGGLPFKLEEIGIGMDSAFVVCRYEYDGKRKEFPFPFDFQVKITINGGTGLTVRTRLTNTGPKAMPVGIGWHPYFKLKGKADKWQLKLPRSKRVIVDDRMIPTGEQKSYTKFSKLSTIGDTVLDTAFKLQRKKGQAKILMTNDKMELVYWQEAATFPFFQVFTPPMRKSVALEPMSCNIDAFNNGEGLQVLQKEETLEGSFGVNVNLL